MIPENRKHVHTPVVVESNSETFHISGAVFPSVFIPLNTVSSVDVLLYVSEGFLPFLNVFYSQAYKNQHDSKLKKLTEEIAKSTYTVLSVNTYFA